MSDHRVTVFPTTGGVSVEVDENVVSIYQDSIMGEQDDCVAIPRALLPEVLTTIFARLDPWELKEISDRCEDAVRVQKET